MRTDLFPGSSIFQPQKAQTKESSFVPFVLLCFLCTTVLVINHSLRGFLCVLGFVDCLSGFGRHVVLVVFR